MELKYIFTAEYSDGTTHTQNAEDTSITREDGSSFTDVDQEKLVKFHLDGPDGRYSVDLTQGVIDHDGQPVAVEGEPFVATNPLRLIYGRLHTHSKTSAAVFKIPQSAKSLDDGQLLVVDSKGQEHIFPVGAEIAQEKDGDITIYKVWPQPDSHLMEYVLGFESEDGAGVLRKRTINIT